MSTLREDIRRVRTDELGTYRPLKWSAAIQMEMDDLRRLQDQRATLERALAVLIEHDLKPGQDELVAGIVTITKDVERVEQRLREAP